MRRAERVLQHSDGIVYQNSRTVNAECAGYYHGAQSSAPFFLSQLLLRSKQFQHLLGANLLNFQILSQDMVNRRLSKPSAFHVFLTVIQQLLSTKEHTRSMFSSSQGV